MRTAALLLAAGQSRRFGAEDKLLAPLGDTTVIGKTMAALSALPCEVRLAVVSSPKVAQLAYAAGFEVLAIPPGLPQSQSLRRGLETLRSIGPARLLVALADMPFVETRDFLALLTLAGPRTACMERQGAPMPPAVFPASLFPALAMGEGDRGAAPLLQQVPPSRRLHLPPERLHDIDRVEDLLPARPGVTTH